MSNTKKISTEELWAKWYFEELLEAGIIKTLVYQPEPFTLNDEFKVSISKIKQLKTKSKVTSTTKTLISSHIYTPDFFIEFKKENKLHKCILDPVFIDELPTFFSHGYKSYIEIKGSWDNNNMTRLFKTGIQPVIFSKYGTYINLIKIPDLFKTTFIPKKVLPFMYYKKATKKNKVGDKKYDFDYKTLEEYINEK